MDLNHMKQQSLKILLNAEPFGFGPAAAIATFFPHLRDSFKHIGYLGTRHTLDLQKPLHYDALYDSADYNQSEMESIIKEYDVFITALDFEMASLANSLGLRVIIYDPLTWFWKDLHPAITISDLYIAQNFIGVKERIEREAESFPVNTVIVPPIVTVPSLSENRELLLVNMGGLQNPNWEMDDVERYARSNLQAIEKILGSLDGVVIATSSAIAARLTEYRVQSYSRKEMEQLLSRTKLAFMTPGLGNIYDAASYAIPTVWLPATNESQQEQFDLMMQKGMVDAALNSEGVLEHELPVTCSTKRLLDEFGSNGALSVGNTIKAFV